MCFGDSEQTQTSETKLPAYIDDGARDLVKKARALSEKPYGSYEGERVADFTADQNTAFQRIRDLISGAPQVGGEAAAGARRYASAPAQDITTERIIDETGRLGSMNDYINPNVEAALAPALKKIMEASADAKRQIGTSANMSNAFGDARQGVLEDNLMGTTLDSIGSTTASFMNDAWNQAMGYRNQDLNRFKDTDVINANYAEQALGRDFEGTGSLITRQAGDQANQLELIKSLLSSGTAQQAGEQANLDADYEDFLRGYAHDFNVLDALRGALGVNTSRTTTQTQSSPDNSGFNLLGALGGAFASSPAGSAALAALI